MRYVAIESLSGGSFTSTGHSAMADFPEHLLAFVNLEDHLNVLPTLIGRQLLYRLLKECNYFDTSTYILRKSPAGKLSFTRIPLHFNISHSQDFVVCAIDTEFPIGIDVEQVRPFDLGLIDKFCTTAQKAVIAEKQDPQSSFIQLWTAKEAIYKCEGIDTASMIKDIDGMESIFSYKRKKWHVQTLQLNDRNFLSIASAIETGLSRSNGPGIDKYILTGN